MLSLERTDPNALFLPVDRDGSLLTALLRTKWRPLKDIQKRSTLILLELFLELEPA